MQHGKTLEICDFYYVFRVWSRGESNPCPHVRKPLFLLNYKNAVLQIVLHNCKMILI